MTNIEDEIKKLSRATGGLVQSSQFYLVGLSSNTLFHRSPGMSIADLELEIHKVVDSEVKALQIIDLAHYDNVAAYRTRLLRIHDSLLAGADVDALIQQLFRDLRHPDENQTFTIDIDAAWPIVPPW